MKVVMLADEAMVGRCIRGTTNWAAAIGKAVQDAVMAAAQQAAPVLRSDGWQHENGLLYRLTDDWHPSNRDEINVTMADGSRSIESCSRRALELLDRIRATAPQPEAAVDERAAFEVWYCKQMEEAGYGPDCTINHLREENHYGERRVMLNGKWEGWQARAALAAKGEQP